MTDFLLAVTAVMSAAAVALVYRIFMIRKTARKIREEFEKKVCGDTNTLIDIPCRDRAMAELAESINRELRILRRERNRFIRGDMELKTAVTNISHDLRTPLTAIFGYLAIMEQENLTEEAAKCLDQIRNRTYVMKQYTEELFRYSMISSEKKTDYAETDLRNVLEETLISFYGVMKSKKIEPEVELPDKPVVRKTDPAALGRIFGNIISNALKYSDGDFRVHMSEKGRIVFSNRADNLDCVTAAQLFDRFYTVESGRNSTGIGLSIAKLLTERLGGKTGAEYKENRLNIIVDFTERNKDA